MQHCPNCRKARLERCEDFFQCPNCDSTYYQEDLDLYNEEAINFDLEEIEKALKGPYTTLPDNIKTEEDFMDWIDSLD